MRVHAAAARLVARGFGFDRNKGLLVGDVMKREPITISPDDSTLHAIQLMRERRIACLPVVKGERLVGIITERDLMNVAAELLEEQLRESS